MSEEERLREGLDRIANGTQLVDTEFIRERARRWRLAKTGGDETAVEISRQILSEREKGGTLMIDREGGDIVFHCDSCTEYLETGEREFGDALRAMRNAGWSAYREDDVWCHACPTCQEG